MSAQAGTTALTTAVPLEDLPRSRAAAKSSGCALYFLGVPCRHGHLESRRTRDAKCSACVEVDAAVKNEAKAREAAKVRAKANRKVNAARRAKAIAADKERDRKDTARRAARAARAKARATAKAVATRAASRAAKVAASRHEVKSVAANSATTPD